MKVIKPVTITEDLLVSTSATETTAAWSSTTTYNVNDIVYYGYKGIYKSLTATNLNHQPDTSITNWLWISSTNKWAMFDTQVSTTTDQTTSITVKIKVGAIDTLALLNLEASSVSITVRETSDDASNLIYTGTQSLDSTVLLDWYEYFFTPLSERRKQVIFYNVNSSYANACATITITNSTGVTASCGAVSFGNLTTLGSTELGTTSGIIDYSTKTTNEFGDTTFVKRAYSKRLTARVLIDNALLGNTQRVLYNLRATPALWIASSNPQLEDALVVFGYYKDFSTDIAYRTNSYCSLEIEGLI